MIVAGCGLLLLIVWGYAAGWAARWLPAGAEAPFALPAPGPCWLGHRGGIGRFHLPGYPDGAAPVPGVGLFDLMILVVVVLWLGSRGLPYNQLTTPEAYFDLQAAAGASGGVSDVRRAGLFVRHAARQISELVRHFLRSGDLAEIEGMYASQLDPAGIYDYVVAVKHKEVLA